MYCALIHYDVLVSTTWQVSSLCMSARFYVTHAERLMSSCSSAINYYLRLGLAGVRLSLSLLGHCWTQCAVSSTLLRDKARWPFLRRYNCIVNVDNVGRESAEQEILIVIVIQTSSINTTNINFSKKVFWLQYNTVTLQQFRVVMIVCSIKEKTIRTVLCCTVYSSCAQS